MRLQSVRLKLWPFDIAAQFILPQAADFNRYLNRERQDYFKAEIAKLAELGKGINLFQLQNILAFDNEVREVNLNQPQASLPAREGVIYELGELALSADFAND